MWVQNWILNIQWPAAICGQNTWSCLHSTELARSETAAHRIWYPLLPHSSLGLVATTLKPSSLTPLCYSTLSRGDPGIPQIPPLLPQEWLGTCLLHCKSPRPYPQAVIHTEKHPGWKGLRTSLVLLGVWSTLNSDRIAQSVILLGLENLQRWGFHSLSGHPVLVAFVLVEFHDVPSLAYSSSLPRSRWREALCLSVPTSLPQSSAKVERLHSISSSRPLIKILNVTGPKTDTWETPLVTNVQVVWAVNVFSVLLSLLSDSLSLGSPAHSISGNDEAWATLSAKGSFADPSSCSAVLPLTLIWLSNWLPANQLCSLSQA